MPIAKCRSHQFSSHHIQRLLAGEPTDSLAISGKSALRDFGSLVAGQSVKDQSHRLCFTSPRRTCDARNSQSKGCTGAPAYPFCETDRYLAAHSAVFFDEFRRDIGERSLQLIGIDNSATHKVT